MDEEEGRHAGHRMVLRCTNIYPDSMSDENESSSDEAMEGGKIKVGPSNKAYFIPVMGHKGMAIYFTSSIY